MMKNIILGLSGTIIMKHRHNIYLTDKAQRCLDDELINFKNKSELICAALIEHFKLQRELNYFNSYLFNLKLEVQRLEDRLQFLYDTDFKDTDFYYELLLKKSEFLSCFSEYEDFEKNVSDILVLCAFNKLIAYIKEKDTKQ